MVMTITGANRRLTRADWVTVAQQALVDSGPDAVAIEPLAAALGTTKGSGYHHFRSRGELLTAALDAYRAERTMAIIDQVEQVGGTPLEKLTRLFDTVTSRADRGSEIRLLASTDLEVRATVERVTAERVGYLASLMAQLGFGRAEARRRALVTYCAYLGHSALADATPAVLPQTAAANKALRDTLIGALTSGSA